MKVIGTTWQCVYKFLPSVVELGVHTFVDFFVYLTIVINVLVPKLLFSLMQIVLSTYIELYSLILIWCIVYCSDFEVCKIKHGAVLHLVGWYSHWTLISYLQARRLQWASRRTFFGHSRNQAQDLPCATDVMIYIESKEAGWTEISNDRTQEPMMMMMILPCYRRSTIQPLNFKEVFGQTWT